MIVFRLSRRKFRDDLSGTGAFKHGGRWNSKGKNLVYCGETRALCTTEIAVHTPYGNIPDDYYLAHIYFPDNSIEVFDQNLLPDNWNFFPHKETTQKIGDRFIAEAKHLVLKVPSATVQGEHNFLLNPLHTHMHKVVITQTEHFAFDSRLFTKV
jgi:RES domain-containing protein